MMKKTPRPLFFGWLWIVNLSPHKDHQDLYVAWIYSADAAGLAEGSRFYFFEFLERFV